MPKSRKWSKLTMGSRISATHTLCALDANPVNLARDVVERPPPPCPPMPITASKSKDLMRPMQSKTPKVPEFIGIAVVRPLVNESSHWASSHSYAQSRTGDEFDFSNPASAQGLLASACSDRTCPRLNLR